MADAPMTVVETEEFLRKTKPPMSDPEREQLVVFMGANPDAGKIIPEAGGVRKVRWGLAGRDKRSCPPIRRTRRRTSARPSVMQ
ncbi:MAG: addiction module toxin RelE [Acidobacteriia bacterium]|nr:addiction module toxin RelE [Terriglobia bacterium]